MITPYTGMIGLTRIGGRVGVGIAVAQFLLRMRHPFCPIQHTFTTLGNNEVLEAMPGGAIITPLDYYLHPDRAKHTVYIDLHLTEEQKERFDEVGRKMVGIPYGFAQYGALTLKRFGMDTEDLDKQIQDRGNMICSQMSDEHCARAGIHLYADHRLPQNVIPWDLWNDFYLNKSRWPKT